MNDLKSMDDKKIKPTKLWTNIMETCETILEFDLEETYLDSLQLFKIIGAQIWLKGVCGPNYLKTSLVIYCIELHKMKFE